MELTCIIVSIPPLNSDVEPLTIPLCYLESFNKTFFYLLQKADLAVADLTITYEREQGVDFTMPFMNLGEI